MKSSQNNEDDTADQKKSSNDLDGDELAKFISDVTSELVQKLQGYCGKVKPSDVFANAGKFTDVYQAVFHAQILRDVFTECLDLKISSSRSHHQEHQQQQMSVLNDLIDRLRKELLVKNL